MTWSADTFHVGPQKTGTTWVYQCFREHPEVVTSEVDAIHYYSMLYYKGNDWYRRQFPASMNGGIAFDPTPNYLRAPRAPERIAADNPQARIIICLREPIERAFSHYWHEKKKARFDFGFDEVLTNFDLFTNWLEPGFYAIHISRFLDHFPRDQIKVALFDDLDRDPAGFIRELFAFAGVSPGFTPSVLGQKVNVAIPRRSLARGALRKLGLGGLMSNDGGMETVVGVPHHVLRELRTIVEPELIRLEELLDLDLSSWRDRYRDDLSRDS